MSSATIKKKLADLHPDTLPTPSIAADFADNMKLSDCLPEALAIEVARQRLLDSEGVKRVPVELGEQSMDEAEIEAARGRRPDVPRREPPGGARDGSGPLSQRVVSRQTNRASAFRYHGLDCA